MRHPDQSAAIEVSLNGRTVPLTGVHAKGPMKIGDRVQMTREAIQQQLDGRYFRRLGVIVGYSRDKQFIRVLRDGDISANTWSPRLWRKIR